MSNLDLLLLNLSPCPYWFFFPLSFFLPFSGFTFIPNRLKSYVFIFNREPYRTKNRLLPLYFKRSANRTAPINKSSFHYTVVLLAVYCDRTTLMINNYTGNGDKSPCKIVGRHQIKFQRKCP